MNSTEVSWFVAAMAGFLSFLSPCVLPLIPGYISLISGISLQDLQEGAGGQVTRTLFPCSLFVLGFSVVFTLLGASASLLGGFLIQYKDVLNKISGLLIIFMGLFILGIIKIPKLYEEKRFHISTHSLGRMGAFPLGMAFAFAWTPCVGPILSSILLYASATEAAGKGAFLLLLYSLGLGIPFIITGLAFSYALSAFGWVRRHYQLINSISAGLLILMGIMLLADQWRYFASFVSRVFS